MWDAILNKFKKYPAQEGVVRLLLERGFQVTPDGKVASGGIKLAHTQIAKEVGVDRRACGGSVCVDCELISQPAKIAMKRDAEGGAGIPKDEAEWLGLPREDYLPETTEEMIVAHADNLVDDTERISIDERIRRMRGRGFDSDAIDRMMRLHTAVMGRRRRS